jgi:HD-GYP domain-containing protein (c-di-GMP phosphodiesterase class II)
MSRTISLLAGIIAGSAGAAALRSRRARTRTERLAAALLETLLRAIDANDAETGRHVRRVGHSALLLAEAAGLDEHAQRAVERVALFHDIGKIHAALFDLVHEPSELSPEERAEIATHPERGARVLAPLDAFYPTLADGVRSHHERWDGTGYPRRLAGMAIPLEARIVAIADAFDAITQGRRYREPRTLEQGRDIVAKGRGSQFDPVLLDLFLSEPVFERVRSSLEVRPAPRRAARASATPAPDVEFRWRSENGGASSEADVTRASSPPATPAE